MAIEIAKVIVDANIKASKLDGLLSSALLAATKSQCEMRSGVLNSTPHEHFNSKGNIDKRKVKRYNNKHKPYSTIKIGESTPLTMEHLKALKDKMCSTEIDHIIIPKSL